MDTAPVSASPRTRHDRDLLQALLDGPSVGRLRLPADLEEAYQAYHRRVAIEHIGNYWPAVAVSIGLIGASLFVFRLVPAELFWLVIFGIACFYALVVAVVRAARSPALERHLTLLVGAASAAGLFAMHVGTLLVMPGEPLYTIPQFGVVMVTVAVFTISNLLLRPALVAALLATATFLVLAAAAPVLVEWRIVATYTIGSLLLGVVIAFAQEVRERTVFLQGRLLLLEKREVDKLAGELDALSRQDALTGLANRRSFDEALAREWAGCQREAEPLGVLFIDVDFFKRYNDHYGHPAGDACLAQVAHALAQHGARARDVVARYGGEEFVLLLPGTDTAGAAGIAARIVAAVDALAIPHAVSDAAPVVTVSIGVASRVPVIGGDVADLLQAADGALYRAKAEGRHRMRLADGAGVGAGDGSVTAA